MSASLVCPPFPCNTCPYRRDTPAGIWHPSEYTKLAEYDDDPPGENVPLATFHCHQEKITGRPTVCRGWLAVHGDIPAVRLAVIRGEIPAEEVNRPVRVPLYGSGREACAAGLRGVRRPGREARAAISRLAKRGDFST